MSREKRAPKAALQNIPVRTAEGRALKDAFGAPAQALVEVDYSALEHRVAWLAKHADCDCVECRPWTY